MLFRCFFSPSYNTPTFPFCFRRKKNNNKNKTKKLYYIRFDGTGVCVESCPDETDWGSLWGCTDDKEAFTEIDCASSTANTADCLSEAGLDSTGEGGTFSGDGEGFCMYQVESMDCECSETLAHINNVKRVDRPGKQKCYIL